MKSLYERFFLPKQREFFTKNIEIIFKLKFNRGVIIEKTVFFLPKLKREFFIIKYRQRKRKPMGALFI